MKRAVVRPLLKKGTLDHNNFKNYRPVSNLSFISKIIEKVVAELLKGYIKLHNLAEPMQSANRAFHSTETALLRIKNDLLTALHEKKMTALLLLDLSSAFDTIYYSCVLKTILESMAKHYFGLNHT